MSSPRYLAAFLLCGLVATEARAHPGSGIVVDRLGRVYFIAHLRIMKIDTDGLVAPLEVDRVIGNPHHLAIDRHGNLYTTSDRDGRVWRITPDGETTQVYPTEGNAKPVLVGAGGDPFTIDSAGNIYCVVTPDESRIVKITPDGTVTTLAGGEAGHADGRGAEARFGNLHAATMAWGPEGALYVTDRTRVRWIAPDGTVSTLAITEGPDLARGWGLAVDGHGTVYVADPRSRRVLRITPDGRATVLAGSRAPGRAVFFRPVGVAIGQDGDVYVKDDPFRSGRVWKISADGIVTMVAGGALARLAWEYGMLLFLPLLLILWAWSRRRRRRPGRSALLAFTGVYVMWVLWAGGWSYVSPYLRFLLLGLFLAVALVPFLRVHRAANSGRTQGMT